MKKLLLILSLFTLNTFIHSADFRAQTKATAPKFVIPELATIEESWLKNRVEKLNQFLYDILFMHIKNCYTPERRKQSESYIRKSLIEAQKRNLNINETLIEKAIHYQLPSVIALLIEHGAEIPEKDLQNPLVQKALTYPNVVIRNMIADCTI